MAATRMSLVLLCIVVASAAAAPTKHIGSFITPCSLKDPGLNDCMLTQAKAIWPHLVQGVREWGLPTLDPLFVSRLELQNSGNSAVNLEMTGVNITFQGYKDMVIESLMVDPKSLHFEMTVNVPVWHGNGQYKTKGHVLLLPISGEGTAMFQHDNHRMKLSLDFKREENKGKKIMKLTKAGYTLISASKILTHMDNLFGNKQLSDNMNKIINENSQAVFKELKAPIEVALSEMAFAVLEPMFDRIPRNELFKDEE